MLEYQKNRNDAECRIVSLNSADQSDVPYQSMDEYGAFIPYEYNQVLEIKDSNGKRRLEYNGTKKPISCSRAENVLRIPTDIPLYRLWVKKRGEDGGLWYKVPFHLPVVEGKYEMLIPGGAQNVELVGDEYFMMVYDLR